MNAPFSLGIPETLIKYKSDQAHGLSDQEVLARQTKYGPNELPHEKRKNIIFLFLSQLNDWLIYILLVAVGITAYMGEHIDACIISLVIIINAVLGMVQEVKAEKAIEALRKMTQHFAVVKRNGKIFEIPSSEVVPGDIILIEAGRNVPADIRLLSSHKLQIDESMLTGESLPTKKDANILIEDEMVPIGDRKNMLYMSTLVTSGDGIGVAVDTGTHTEIGKIATILQEDNTIDTPLKKRLDHLGKTLGKMCVAICMIIFALGFFQDRPVVEIFLISVSLAVAAIPEGLAAIVAVVLSLGITKMSKHNAIVKQLPAVETLGSVDIICSDKTGTLTQNQMTVTQIYTPGTSIRNIQKNEHPSKTEELLTKAMLLCNNASYSKGVALGDPTEVALLLLADNFGIERASLSQSHTRIHEIHFDSERKLMSTQIKEKDGHFIYTKGAVDTLLTLCTHVCWNGKKIPFEDEMKQAALKALQSMSSKALRTLGAAYKKVKKDIPEDQMEQDLTFIGLVGMTDPPRPEVARSIQKAKEAGIRPVMITGDYPSTAFAIGYELGIVEKAEQVITGKELDEMSETNFIAHIDQYRIFARVSPQHKVRIVKAFQSRGHVVSMTGDGVNDAPSLKAADIGIAMGITGTDVSKGAADMILVDDNFSTIVRAVELGRNIYNNIKKSVLFLLMCNLGEVVTVFVILLIGWEAPLLAIQLLWINLITDSLPAVALGMDPEEKGVMKEKPRKTYESFFSHGGGIRTACIGSLIGAICIFIFWWSYHLCGYSPFDKNIPESVLTYARTMTFMTLVLLQVFFTLSLRSIYHSIFSRYTFSNVFLLVTIVISVGIQLCLIYIPSLTHMFHLTSLALSDWYIILGASIIPIIANECYKKFTRIGEHPQAA